MQVYLDNIIFSLQRTGGISVYWYELAKRFALSDNVTFIDSNSQTKNHLRNTLELNHNLIHESTLLPLKLRKYLPFYGAIKSPSIFHSSYYRIINNRQVANIVTVHDFIYEKYRKGAARIVNTWHKRNALSKADGIICISKSTKHDLLKYNPEIPEEKIRIIYHGVSDVFHPLEHPTVSELGEIVKKRYALFVGGRKYYKNFDLAVEVVSNIEDMSLVVVGDIPLLSNEKYMLDEKLSGRNYFLGNVDTCSLNVLYNFAFCLLYPSSYEGFGIPVLEAMKAGCPVVTSGYSSLPEVCGNVGLMAKNLNADCLTELLGSLEDVNYRNEIIQKGHSHARKFSWDKCAKETFEFYETIHEDKFNK